MCLIVFGYGVDSHYDFILAANRDEFYGRPTRAAQFWDNQPQLLAGKDLSAGGTWMGINRRGQLAALTNYRDPSIQKQNPPSRGTIVADFLKEETKTSSFLKKLHTQSDQFMGFNLLAGHAKALFHYSNQEQKINRVEPGIHALSNALLDTPWPKVARAKDKLGDLIDNEKLATDDLFKLLQDDQPAPDEVLPDTGIPAELEKQVSPIFIKGDEYGTRSSTVLLIDKEGNLTFEERRYKPATMNVDETNRFEFKIARR